MLFPELLKKKEKLHYFQKLTMSSGGNVLFFVAFTMLFIPHKQSIEG
jgi:hypothetical protein